MTVVGNGVFSVGDETLSGFVAFGPPTQGSSGRAGRANLATPLLGWRTQSRWDSKTLNPYSVGGGEGDEVRSAQVFVKTLREAVVCSASGRIAGWGEVRGCVQEGAVF
jgi:hypothetical protein